MRIVAALGRFIRRELVVVAGSLAIISLGAWAADNYRANTPSSGNITFRSHETVSGVHSPMLSIMGGDAATEANAAKVGSDGSLQVDNSSHTQPVSGSVGITGSGQTLYVFDTGTHDSAAVAIVDASGNQVTSFGGATATDDAAFTPASGTVSPIGGCVTTDDVDSGDSGCVAMTDDRALNVYMVDGQGDSAMDDANNALKVNVVSGPAGGTSTTDDAAFTIGTTAVTPMGCIEATDSVDAGDVGGVKCGADRELDIDVVSGPTGSSALQTQGEVAHDAADANNPEKIGGRARTSDITAVANDDRTDAIFDTTGAQVVRPYALHENLTQGCANSTGTGDTQIIAAPGAGRRLYITRLTVFNLSSTNSYIQIKSATTVKDEAPAPANYGGSTVSYGAPLRLAANEALNFASVTGVTTMRVCANGYSAAN